MTRLDINAYRVVDDAVERGIAYGWQRAHKHTDTPTPEAIRAAIADAVMQELSEYVIWPEPA